MSTVTPDSWFWFFWHSTTWQLFLHLITCPVFSLFTPAPPLFLFCSVSFLSYAGIIPVIVGEKRFSVAICLSLVVRVPRGGTSCDAGSEGAGQSFPFQHPAFCMPGSECHFHCCPFNPGICVLLTKLISLVEKTVDS